MARLKWNIYTLRVGFIGNGDTKLRPVIVLNEPVGAHKIILVAPIYSHKANHNAIGDITIFKKYTDLGLVKSSTIRLHRMVSVLASDLEEQLGQASPDIRQSITSELHNLFKLHE